MDSDGVGKIRQKRSQQGSKPYERKPSLLKRFGSSVRDLLMPSWLGGGTEDPECSNKMPQSSKQPASISSQSERPSSMISSEENRVASEQSPSLSQTSKQSGPTGQNSYVNLTKEDSAKLRMSDSYVSDQVESFPVRPITVSTGTFNKTTPASKKQKLWTPEIARAGKPLVPPAAEKPSFNRSLFGSVDKNETSFFGDSFRESSFYSGKTRYGGAAAEKKSSLNKSLPYQSSLPLRKQVKANQMNKSFQAVTSATAQRIMDTLEKMSTPLGDAKKIPRADTSNDSILSFTPSSYRKTSLLGASRSATRPLQLPKGPPTNRYQMVGREGVNRYRPSGVEKSDYSDRSGSFISQEQVNIQERENLSVATEASTTSGTSGKMKTKKFSSHISSKVEESDIPQVPNLRTDFTLPVSGMKPITLSTISGPNSDPQPSHSSSLLTENSPLKFTFSTPIQKTQPSVNLQTPQDKDYTFSTPIQAAKTSAAGAEEGSKLSPEPAVGASSASGHFASSSFSSTSTPVWGSTAARPKPKAASPDIGGTSSSFSSYSNSKWGNKDSSEVSAASECPGGFMSPATSLKKGSVMDILGGSLKAPKAPSEAPLKNVDEDAKKADVPASAAKAGATIPVVDDLFAKFAKPAGSWECEVCMLSNKPEALKCVACEAPRPGLSASQTTSQPQVTVISNNNNSLAAMFKPPPGNWECDVCMIQNTATALKCIACETAKPGLQSAGIVEAPKPLTNGPEIKISPEGGFSLNLPSATSEGSGGFKFGNTVVTKPSGPSTASTGFVFGGNSEVSSKDKIPSTGFVFGGSSEASKDKSGSESSSGGFSFGSSKISPVTSNNVSKPSQTSGGFVFGAVSNSSTSSKDSQVSTGFQFGSLVPQVSQNSDKPVSSNPVSIVGSETPKVSVVTPAFQFGSVSNSDNKHGKSDSGVAQQTSSTPFSFSAQTNKPPTVSTTASTSFNFSQPTSTHATSQPVTKPSSGLFTFGGSATQSAPAGSAGLGMGASLSQPTAPIPVLNGGFGSSLDPKPGSNAAGGFKSGFNGSAATPVFNFGQSSQPNAATSGPPLNKRSVDFSNADHSPAKKSGNGQPNGLFSFGGNTSSTAAPSGGFGGFGAASPAAPQPATGGFSFGGSAAGFGQPPAPQPPTPAFGSTSAQPATGGFNFSMGSTPNFNFGSSSSQPVAPPQGATTPFQFGGNTSDSTASASNSGLFQFSAAPAASTPAFAGAPAAPGGFSIGSSDASRRPIKKAIRKIRR